MTMERVLQFWEGEVVPEVKRGKRVLLVGHRTCFGSIVKHLNKMSEEGRVVLT